MNKFAAGTTASFDQKIKKLDRPVAKRTLERLYGLAALGNPREACKPMTGPLTGLWRLSTGDYRASIWRARGELNSTKPHLDDPANECYRPIAPFLTFTASFHALAAPLLVLDMLPGAAGVSISIQYCFMTHTLRTAKHIKDEEALKTKVYEAPTTTGE